MAGKKKTFAAVKAQVVSGLDKGRKQAEQEMEKVRKQVSVSIKKVDAYIRKNPEKAAMISAGIGMALGAAVAKLIGGKKKK